MKLKKERLIERFIKYAGLNVLGMLGLSCYILADTFFVSKAMGADGLTALNFAISIYAFIHGSGLMLGIGGAIKYNVFQVLKERKKANTIFSLTLTMGIVVGIIFGIMGLCGTTFISYLLGARGLIHAMTSQYLKIILLFAPCFICNNIFLAFVRNDGDPKLSMTAMIVGSLSNIVLDYIFIFPCSMGMVGAALATGIAPIISMVILSIHLWKKQQGFHLQRYQLAGTYVKDIINLGLSAFITEVASGVVLIVFNLVILELKGNIGVAAYGVIANLALVVIAIFTGIAQGIQPLISEAYGKNQRHVQKSLLQYALMLSTFIAATVYLLTMINSQWLIHVFNSEYNAALNEIATQGLRLYFIGFFFAGLNIIVASYFSAMEQPRKSFAISMVRGCVAIIPCVLILGAIFKMNGVWISFVVAEMMAVIISAFCLWNTRNKDCHRQEKEI